MPPPHADLHILEAALVGYSHKIQELETRIADLLSNSNGTKPAAAHSELRSTPKKKRRWSAATRKRMAESQRKRWAAIKAKQDGKS